MAVVILKRVLVALAVVSALVIAAIAVLWTQRAGLAAGMMVVAPPHGARVQPPADVSEVIESARGDVRIRAWRLEPTQPPRGTLLMLHGIRDNKQNLLPSARAHVARGWRTIAVDSRGHGESTGRFLTYGVEESRDLVALVDQLAKRGLLVAPLAVMGSSYGAATALQFAAIDARVARVAAVSPFASLREVVPAYFEWILGPPARLVPRAAVDELVDGAAKQAGFDADDACPRCVAPRIRAPVLFVHSRDDERIPWRQSERIRAALRVPSQLVLIRGVGHVYTGGPPEVAEAIASWLDAAR